MLPSLRSFFRQRLEKALGAKDLVIRYDVRKGMDAEDVAVLDSVRPFTMAYDEGIAAVVDAVNYVERAGIAGDFVECGVWKGGVSMAAALTLMRHESVDRDLYLFDTFEGMSEPTEHDRAAHNNRSAAEWLSEADRSVQDSVWAYSPIEEVKANLASTGYPGNKVHFVRGKVEETIPGTLPDRIAILRLDTDWYESTRHELVHLYPRLVPGGVLLIDDYGYWEGARRAVDEYFEEHSPPLFLGRVDYTGRVSIKR